MNELTISLTPKKGHPMYEQIYNYIRDEIQKGSIKAGEKLPSTRALSVHLGVSRSTVDMAYEQLLAEGYMASIPCKGYYVCEIDQLYKLPPAKAEQEETKEAKSPKYPYEFTMNGIDKDGFPYNIWRKISKNVLNEDDGTLFQLGDSQGQESLRKEIAVYLHHARGVNCQANQIVVGAGNDYLLLLLHVMLGMKWKIAMDNPTYISAYKAFEKMGYQVCPMEPDDKGMDPEQLKLGEANLAYVMPSHQFPLGSVMPIKRRQELLSWAAEGEDRYLIEDDYDSEFRYKGKPIPSLQGFDSHDRVIYLGTFSRSLAPAIRISYMVLPKRLLKQYEKQAKSFSVTVSRVDQKILEVFLRDGHFERHLNRMRGIYRAKHDCLLNELRSIHDICRVRGENAGVHIVIEMKNGMNEQEAVRRAKDMGVRLYGLSDYCIKPLEKRGIPTVLMGYASLKEEEIKEAVSRLKKAWSGF
ncbi:MAG: PLP-dependent aminotransferase family protein [Clostridia bacterium]|nr:PLP-dependent aminotransferase family protein [Clostridia bacterium]NCC43146.1 PLP-dependent aminotransferase family protein [Clostridia bacterium]